jgi:hypothetical protein
MGAEFMDSWRNVRVTGDALHKLAGDAKTAAASATPSAHPQTNGSKS